MTLRYIVLPMLVASLVSYGNPVTETPVSVPSQHLPPIETFVLEPIERTSISIWVPADKSDLFVNRDCRNRDGQMYSCTLPAEVHHTKGGTCLEPISRLLAEHAWRECKKIVPLTIFNGWQWDYHNDMCQYQAFAYDLARRGGSWENALEAILSYYTGRLQGEWLSLYDLTDRSAKTAVTTQQSAIEISTFSNLRTRNGYPKERQLPN